MIKKMMFGPDGFVVERMTWQHFVDWQQFPKGDNDPPMTTDFVFWFRGKKYYCTGEDYGYVIVDKDWKRIGYNKSFVRLLESPVLDGKSFRDRLGELLVQP